MGRLCNESHGTILISMQTHTHKDLQHFKTISLPSSTPFLQLIHNNYSASIFKGLSEAAGIHRDEHNKAHQLSGHEERNNKENQLNTPNEG